MTSTVERRDQNGEALRSGTGGGKSVRRRSGQLGSYCTKSIFGAHYGEHVKVACALQKKQEAPGDGRRTS